MSYQNIKCYVWVSDVINFCKFDNEYVSAAWQNILSRVASNESTPFTHPIFFRVVDVPMFLCFGWRCNADVTMIFFQVLKPAVSWEKYHFIKVILKLNDFPRQVTKSHPLTSACTFNFFMLPLYEGFICGLPIVKLKITWFSVLECVFNTIFFHIQHNLWFQHILCLWYTNIPAVVGVAQKIQFVHSS